MNPSIIPTDPSFENLPMGYVEQDVSGTTVTAVDHPVVVRFDPEDMDVLDQMAAQSGRSVPQIIRNLVLRNIK